MGVGNPMGMGIPWNGIAVWLIMGTEMGMGIMQREWEEHIFNV